MRIVGGMPPAFGHSAALIVVVTAFRPSAGMLDRLSPMLQVCQAIVISDNTPGGSSDLADRPGFKILRHGANLGLGAALNAGVQWALAQGANRVLLLDQDSELNRDLVQRLSLRLDGLIGLHGPRVCVGPTHVEPGAVPARSSSHGSEVQDSPTPGARERTCLPTSGMLISLEAPSAVEEFSSEFFLDLVDYEWCWRLRQGGWRFFRAEDLELPHRRGLGLRRMLGLSFFDQEPYRHYFQVRDTLRLPSLGYVPLYSLARLLAFMLMKSVMYPLLLDRGHERLHWILLGIRDAWTGRSGIGAASCVLDR